MQAPTALYPTEMGGLIDALATYNNDPTVPGYSVYYYAQNMYQQPGLRFMAVDGVLPSNDAIADGTYPFVNDFYAVLRADSAQNSREHQLLTWLLSDDGCQVVTDAGYVGIG